MNGITEPRVFSLYAEKAEIGVLHTMFCICFSRDIVYPQSLKLNEHAKNVTRKISVELSVIYI